MRWLYIFELRGRQILILIYSCAEFWFLTAIPTHISGSQQWLLIDLVASFGIETSHAGENVLFKLQTKVTVFFYSHSVSHTHRSVNIAVPYRLLLCHLHQTVSLRHYL